MIAAATALAVALPAHAILRDIDVGNFYFEEVATGARDPIRVDQGDQLRFTVREGTYPPHDVVIEGYGPEFQSGQLLLFDRFTTPPLDKPGTFDLFCRAHRQRGHETTLIVRARSSGSAPAPGPSQTRRSSPPRSSTASPRPSATGTGSTAPSVAPSPSSPSLAPVGVDVAEDQRRASPDADSLAALLGRDLGGDAPWTTAVWMWLLAALPIAAVAAFAMRRELRRH